MALGVDQNRTNLLLAVLEKRVGLQLMSDDVFVSVAGGLDVNEPAADLGVAAAIASSFRNRPVPSNTAVFGEVGLVGEVRAIGQPALRVREAALMGFSRCILPSRTCRSTCPASSWSGVASLEGALERLFDQD
jgi:DNA repair protein RadA/Sms